MKAKKRKELKYRSGKAKSDTLERSPEQVRENARSGNPMYRPEKTYEEKLKEAAARRKRNEQFNNINRKNRKPAVFDDQNLRNKDGSPLRGGPKATPIAPKEIPTKTPKKTLKKSKAVIPVPTKKEVRKARRKNRN